MTENTVLPLINTAFEPGNARKAAESFADRDFREIAIAEFYYFTGQAQKCSDLAMSLTLAKSRNRKYL